MTPFPIRRFPCLIVFLVLLMHSVHLRAQGTEYGRYEWVEPFVDADHYELRDIVVDEEQNLYVCGFFTERLFWGSKSYMPHDPRGEAFLSKLDKNRQVVWMRTLTSDSFSMATALSLGPDGNLYLGGTFDGQLSFGGSFYLDADGTTDQFIASYTRNGDFRWSNRFGTGYLNNVPIMKADKDGNLYMGGQFIGESYLPDLDTLIQSTGIVLNTLIGKLDASGTWQWVDLLPENATIQDLELGWDGRPWITCSFRDSFIWRDSLLVPEEDDVFLARLDKDGKLLQIRQYKGTGNERILDMQTGTDSNLYLTGYYTKAFGMDSLLLEVPVQSSRGNGFIARLSAEGNVRWLKAIPAFDVYFNFIDLDEHNNPYLCGRFYDWIKPGGDSLNEGHGAGVNVILLKFDSSGEYRWSLSMEKIKSNSPSGFQVQSSSEGYILGRANQMVEIGNYSLVAAGNSLSYIAKFSTAPFPLHHSVPERTAIRSYPNPATDYFRLKTKHPVQSITLYSLTGQIVAEWSSIRDSYPLPSLAEGTYLLRVETEEGVFTERLLIKGQ